MMLSTLFPWISKTRIAACCALKCKTLLKVRMLEPWHESLDEASARLPPGCRESKGSNIADPSQTSSEAGDKCSLTFDKRVCSINELHADSLQSLCIRRNIQQVQNDGLIGTEHGATGNHWGEGIPNLTYTMPWKFTIESKEASSCCSHVFEGQLIHFKDEDTMRAYDWGERGTAITETARGTAILIANEEFIFHCYSCKKNAVPIAYKLSSIIPAAPVTSTVLGEVDMLTRSALLLISASNVTLVLVSTRYEFRAIIEFLGRSWNTRFCGCIRWLTLDISDLQVLSSPTYS